MVKTATEERSTPAYAAGTEVPADVPSDPAPVQASRLAVLAIPVELPTETVYIPEWNMEFTLRALTAAQVDAWRAECLTGKGAKKDWESVGSQAKLVVRSIVNPDGSRMFSGRDAELWQEKPATILGKLWDVAARLSGVKGDDEDDDAVLGKSATTRNGVRPTD
jgi:hypothetical protein